GRSGAGAKPRTCGGPGRTYPEAVLAFAGGLPGGAGSAIPGPLPLGPDGLPGLRPHAAGSGLRRRGRSAAGGSCDRAVDASRGLRGTKPRRPDALRRVAGRFLVPRDPCRGPALGGPRPEWAQAVRDTRPGPGPGEHSAHDHGRPGIDIRTHTVTNAGEHSVPVGLAVSIGLAVAVSHAVAVGVTILVSLAVADPIAMRTTALAPEVVILG